MRRRAVGILLALALAFGVVAVIAAPAGANPIVDGSGALSCPDRAQEPVVTSIGGGDLLDAIPVFLVDTGGGSLQWEWGQWETFWDASGWRIYGGDPTFGFGQAINNGPILRAYWYVFDISYRPYLEGENYATTFDGSYSC